MNKFLAFLLVIWPYLPWFHKGGYLGAMENYKVFLVYEALSAVLIVVNIVNAGKWESPKDLFFYNIVFGLAHFLYYLIECVLVVYMVPVAWITNMKELKVELTIAVLLIAGLLVVKNVFRNAAIDKALMMGIITEQEDLGFANKILGNGIGDLVLYFKIRKGV